MIPEITEQVTTERYTRQVTTERYTSLIEGANAPQARPIAKVRWEPGKPPGGKPIAKPRDQRLAKH